MAVLWRAAIGLIVATAVGAEGGAKGKGASDGLDGMKVRFEWPTHVLRGHLDRDGTLVRTTLAGLADDAAAAAATATTTANHAGATGCDDCVDGAGGGSVERRHAAAGRPVIRGGQTFDDGFLAGPGGSAARRTLVHAALLAHARFAALVAGEAPLPHVSEGTVRNIRLHRFKGGETVFELKHTAADPRAVSGVYVLRAPLPSASMGGAGPELVLEDPRTESIYFPALPAHLQPSAGANGIWQTHPMVEGCLLLFPGGVPRQVPVTILRSELMFLTFDIFTATPGNPPPSPSPSALPSAAWWEIICAKGEPLADRSARVGQPYRLVLNRLPPTASSSAAADDDVDSSIAIEAVEDLVRWGTPVARFRLPEAAMAALNPALLADATALERWYGKGGRMADGAVTLFQTPGYTNLLNATLMSEYPGLRKARVLVLAAARKYLAATPDCGGLSGQGRRKEVCAQTRAAATRWRQQHPASGGGDNAPDVWSSWLNIGGAGHRGISQMFHTHTAFKTAISGVYYPAAGWSTDAAIAAIPGSVGKSTPLFLRSPVPAEGAVLSLPTHTGTIVLFPSWLEHSGDAHLGDGNRVVLSFNIGLDPESSQPDL